MKIYGEGIATISESGQMLDVYFPNIEFGEQKTEYKTLQVNSGTQEILKFEWTKSDQETLNYEMRKINGIKEILKGIK